MEKKKKIINKIKQNSLMEPSEFRLVIQQKRRKKKLYRVYKMYLSFIDFLCLSPPLFYFEVS